MKIDYQHQEFVATLQQNGYSNHIYTDELRRIAFAHDASFYQLIPQVVVVAANQTQVVQVLKTAYKHHIAVTFRAAGTSLSGQAISDSVLLVIDNNWNKYDILDNATKIRLDPGLIAGKANQYLQPYGKKLGPDPSSINSAKIGGIIANNSSGMCCGTAHNSYNTLYAMQIIFANGDELDTASHESILHFKARNPKLIAGISKLATKVRQSPELSQLICHKYRLKNTTGYGINALLDFTDPIDIIMHLLVGSEGTLGFVSSVVLYTRDSHHNKATALYVFANIQSACGVISDLATIGVDAVELLDRRSLKSIQHKPEMPTFIAELGDSATALLIEISDLSAENLHRKISLCEGLLGKIAHPQSVKFTTDKDYSAKLWNLRHGLFPSAAALRKDGTSILIEDIAFPLEHLAIGVEELNNLLIQHGYHDAIIFGHALSGNLHFIFGQDFNNASEIQRYDELMQSITQLVAVKYKGSLKAEHGTGRNMASFVELEWGVAAYEIMQEIKQLFDPAGILNPDVILSNKPNLYLANLKQMPLVDPIIDKCTECGFCEPVCPSRNLSLTPRQRIVVQRYLSHSSSTEQFEDQKALQAEAKNILKDYQYLGIDTCATTGMCALKCPVGINTGAYMLNLKSDSTNLAQQSQSIKESSISRNGHSKIAKYAATNFAISSQIVRNTLRIADLLGVIIGKKRLYLATKYINRKTQHKTPVYLPSLIRPTKIKLDSLYLKELSHKKAVYFPSCVSRVLNDEAHSLVNTTCHVFNHFGYSIIMADLAGIGDGLCCGQSLASNNDSSLAKLKSDELLQQLITLSDNGKYPICFDTTPCVLHLQTVAINYPQLKIYDMAEFIHDKVLPDLQKNNIKLVKETKPVALHITCSAQRLGLEQKILHIANLCAENVVIPDGIECCGFAGSKGFFVPELNQSALSNLHSQVSGCSNGYSTSGTCELGLSLHSGGVQYSNIMFLLAKAICQIS